MKKIKVEFYRYGELSLENVTMNDMPFTVNNILLEVQSDDTILEDIRPTFTGDNAMTKFNKGGNIEFRVSEVTGAENEKVLMKIICMNTKDSKLTFNHISKDGVDKLLATYPYDYIGPLGYTGMQDTILITFITDNEFPTLLPIREGHPTYVESMKTTTYIPMTHPSVVETIRHFITNKLTTNDYHRIGFPKISIQTYLDSGENTKYDIDLCKNTVEVVEPVETEFSSPILYVGENALYHCPGEIHCTGNIVKAKSSIYDKICMLDLSELKGHITGFEYDVLKIDDSSLQNPNLLLPLSYSSKELARNIISVIYRLLAKDFSEDKIRDVIPADSLHVDISVDGSDYNITSNYVDEYNTRSSIAIPRRVIMGSIMSLYMDLPNAKGIDIVSKTMYIMRKIHLMIHYSGLILD